MIYIGIDPGTHTGLAVWDSKLRKLLDVRTLPIHRALQFVKDWKMYIGDIVVVFEDARQRTWFGKGDVQAKIQGAGSIKRDCSIWEDMCKDYGIVFNAVPPVKGATKLTPEYFKMLTGWEDRTSEHARDAAMLVIGK